MLTSALSLFRELWSINHLCVRYSVKRACRCFSFNFIFFFRFRIIFGCVVVIQMPSCVPQTMVCAASSSRRRPPCNMRAFREPARGCCSSSCRRRRHGKEIWRTVLHDALHRQTKQTSPFQSFLLRMLSCFAGLRKNSGKTNTDRWICQYKPNFDGCLLGFSPGDGGSKLLWNDATTQKAAVFSHTRCRENLKSYKRNDVLGELFGHRFVASLRIRENADSPVLQLKQATSPMFVASIPNC